MRALLLAPVVLSLLLLGAHFLRAGGLLALLGTVVLLFLLAVRRPWAARAVQAALVLGALEWTRTLVNLAARRAAAGESATRLVFILAFVTVVTLGSAWIFQTRPIAERYGLRDEADRGGNDLLAP